LTCLYCVHAVRTVKSGMARNTAAQVSITYPITNEMPEVIKKEIDARARGSCVYNYIYLRSTDIMWYGTAKQASFDYL